MKIKVREIKAITDVSEDFLRAAREGGVNDASETMVLARQMEVVKSRVMERKYQELLGRSLVPKSPDGDNASQFVVVRIVDEYTLAKIVVNYATDFPLVSAVMTEQFAKYFSIGNAFQYSIQDLREAAKAGIQISDRLAAVARRGIEQSIDDVIFRGVSLNGTYGLMNNPNVPVVTLTNGGWANKTFDQILADLNQLAQAVVDNTLTTFLPDTIVMDAPSFGLISARVGGLNYDRTILQVFLANNPYIKTVVQSTKLNTLSPAGGKIMIAYKRDPEVLQLEIGQEFEMFPGMVMAMTTTTACHARVAGVSFFHPFAAAYATNH